MIITTTTMLIVQVIAFTWIIVVEPEPCPNKYMTLEENGGELQNLGDVIKYCDLDNNGRFTLKEE